MLFRIPITGTFDGSTALPATATFVLAADGAYDILDSAGASLVNVGQIPIAAILAEKLIPHNNLLATMIGHNSGTAAATLFQVNVAVPTSVGGVVTASPIRRIDPSVDGYAGPLILGGAPNVLVLDSNAVGVQEAVFEITGVDDSTLAAMLAETAAAEVEDAPDYVVPLLIEDIITANAYVQRFVWNGPTIEVTNLRMVASATIAAGNLVVVPSINGVNITTGALTLAVAAVAGTAATATPSGANVVTNGDVIELSVSGGGNTTAGRAMVSILGEPLTNA